MHTEPSTVSRSVPLSYYIAIPFTASAATTRYNNNNNDNNSNNNNMGHTQMDHHIRNYVHVL